MSTKTLSTSYVRDHMAQVLRELHEEMEVCVVTNHGKPEAILMDLVRYEMMMDLLEDREDEKDSLLGKKIDQARAEYKKTGGTLLKDFLAKRKK